MVMVMVMVRMMMMMMVVMMMIMIIKGAKSPAALGQSVPVRPQRRTTPSRIQCKNVLCESHGNVVWEASVVGICDDDDEQMVMMPMTMTMTMMMMMMMTMTTTMVARC